MDREVGNIDFPIWLIGDSNPPKWQSALKTPLDPRHPVRHSIWTSLLDVIQDKVYRASRRRVDTSTIYIRNAVDDPSKKPASNSVQWGPLPAGEISAMQSLIRAHKPIMLLSFGAFSYEFMRRVVDGEEKRKYIYWSAARLGDEFRHRVENFDPKNINIFPLLHRSISGGKFIQSHNYFCAEEGANYFEIAGGTIANKILEYRDELKIWI